MISRERIAKIISSIQLNYTADAWKRSYPNGMSGVALLEALHGLSENQIKHGLSRVPQDHAGWPLGIAQFANLCRELKVRSGDNRGCSVPGCWLPTSLHRCEHHQGLKQHELHIVTQALNKNRPFVEYQIFVESTSLVSLIDPGQMDKGGERVWTEWSDEMLWMWNRNKPSAGQSPMQYRARIRHEVDLLIDKELYPLSQQA